MIFKQFKKKTPVEKMPKNKDSYLSCVMVVLNEVKNDSRVKKPQKLFRKLILKLRFLAFHLIKNKKALVGKKYKVSRPFCFRIQDLLS